MTIKFNKKLYHISSIKVAAKAFAGLARVEIKNNAGYIFVSFNNIMSAQRKTIADEFSNYVLFVENK